MKIKFMLLVLIYSLVLTQITSVSFAEEIEKPDSMQVKYASIEGGKEFSVAVKEDGKVIVWGSNYYGVCNIPNGLTNVKNVSGSDHLLALKEDGTIAVWGQNEYELYQKD